MEKTVLPKTIGWSFILMFFLGIFAEFLVRTSLIHWDDALHTYTTIRSSLGLFRLGIVAFIVIIFLDIVLSVSFYTLFYTLHLYTALLMASLRLVYVAIKGSAIVGLILAQDIYSSSAQGSTDEVAAQQAMQFLKMHQYGFGLALIFFGVHLIILATLLLKAQGIPKVLSWVLLVAGIGYSTHSFISLFVVEMELLKMVTIAIFIIPMTFSELALGLWIWIKRERILPHLTE